MEEFQKKVDNMVGRVTNQVVFYIVDLTFAHLFTYLEVFIKVKFTKPESGG